ncbi:MAG: radical SAM protein [Nanoarchaeota archaeon]|nr:radical SAM protein [Nanoarchaeota archaeon]
MEPHIIKAGKNAMEFRGLDGRRYIYETVMGTLHKAEEIDVKLLERIMQVRQEVNYGFGGSMASDRLGSLDSLVLNCTESCNLRCGYCIFSGNYEGERVHSGKRMSEETASKAVDYFLSKSSERPYILFYGGEPLLETGLIKTVVEQARQEKAAMFGMTTNFTLAGDYLRFLAENDFLLTVSLDGPKELHDRWRGKGTHEKIMANLKRLENEYPEYFHKRLALSVTMAEPNLEEIRNYFVSEPLLSLLPVRLQSVELNQLANNDIKDKWTEEARTKARNAYWDAAEEYCSCIASSKEPSSFDKALFDLPLYRIYSRKIGRVSGNIFPQGMCVPGARKLFVDIKGDFYMCEKIGGKLRIGNAEEGISLQESKQALGDYCGIRNQACKECWTFRDCPSCAVGAKDKEGISLKGLTLTCGMMKEQVLTGLALYSHILSMPNGKAALDSYLKEYEG